MIGWLWRVIVGRFSLPPLPTPAPLCAHEWATIKEVEVKGYAVNGQMGVVGLTYVLQCKMCGDIKAATVP